MTDLERWRAFADAAGVVYEERLGRGDGDGTPETGQTIYVTVTAGDGPKNTGYFGFFADLRFGPDGFLGDFGVFE